jgi:Cu-Zn family superoxide dismutase
MTTHRLITSVASAALASSLILALAACGGSSSKPAAEPATTPGVEGVAVLESRSDSAATGEARFVDRGDSVEVTLNVAGATPGKHGVHIHEVGDCSSPDAKSAGEHFNPGTHQHGAPGVGDHHAGDFGNIEIAEDGTGTLTLIQPGITLGKGPTSIADRALVLHEKADDFQTQPSGDSGNRIACGVIKVGPPAEPAP